MDLEKNYKISGLFYFYKKLLTTKQQNIFENYYFNDNSLGEIASQENISRQAVKDCLKKCENSLIKYEQKLKLSKIYYSQKKIIEELIENNPKLLNKYNEILKLWED